MALSDAQKKFCFYVIATVETGCNWGGVNQHDPITLGITQWYGQNAWRLMDALRTEAAESYAKLSDRLRALCEGGAQTWGYWNGIYLTDNDAQSFVNSAQDEDNHRVQEQLFYSDLFDDNGNYARIQGWGIDDDPKRGIFYLAMYHQTPAVAGNCAAQLGNASIESLRDWCLATRPFASYPNRYSKIYELLSGWDGVSDPPDFGQTGTVVPGGDDPTPGINASDLQSQISYIQIVGNQLCVFGKMDRTNKLLCRPTGKGIWIPCGGSNIQNPAGGSSDPSGGTVPPASADDPADFPAMRQLWIDNENKWSYGQGGGRLNPEVSGYSDCSAMIYWAQHKATNGKYDWIGTYGGAMDANCTHVYTCPSGDWSLPLDQLRPGDIISFNYKAGGGHVEWYFGNGVLWGAGMAPLPHHTTDHVENFYVGRNDISEMWVLRFLD